MASSVVSAVPFSMNFRQMVLCCWEERAGNAVEAAKGVCYAWVGAGRVWLQALMPAGIPLQVGISAGKHYTGRQLLGWSRINMNRTFENGTCRLMVTQQPPGAGATSQRVSTLQGPAKERSGGAGAAGARGLDGWGSRSSTHAFSSMHRRSASPCFCRPSALHPLPVVCA